jgi:hypothetical protein
MTLPVLPLRDMSDRHRGLTRALAESYLEAARVNLDRHHEPPQEFALHNSPYASLEILAVLVEWEPSDERCRGAWANQDDATRDGAYACAIAATELALGLYTVRRAETRTGQELLQTIWHERDLRQTGIEFVRGQVTIALDGGEVSLGAAPLRLVHHKANEVCNFFYRIIEMTLHRPFRRRGSPGADILEHFRPWLVQASPGSYRFGVRLQKPVQLSLFPEVSPAIEDMGTHLRRDS